MKRYRFVLNNENIDSYVKVLRQVCENNNAERRMMIATCLSLEEILLDYQSRFGPDKEVLLIIRKRLGDIQISIMLHGNSYDPLEKNEEDTGWSVVDAIGLTPKYAYFNGTNHLSLSVKCNKNKSELLVILLSVAFGLIMGLGGRYLPENILTPCHKVIVAISDAIFALLQMASLPVIFLCILNGIVGGGNVSTFRENGLRLLVRFFLAMLLMLLLATGLSFISLNIKLAASAADIPLIDTLVNMLFSILPENIIAPFADGDNLKVIMLGIIFGCAILSLNNRVVLVNQLTEQLKDICSVVMGWISKLIPLLIATVLTDNIWNGNLGWETLSLWKIAALYIATMMPSLLIMMLIASRKLQLPFGKVLKTVLTPGIKGCVSGSSMLCYYDMVDGLTNKFEIPENRVNFGIPLAIAFYQPIIVMYALFVLFFAGKSGLSIDAGWVASFILVTFVTSIAAPPVSGGSVSLLAILFTTLGVSDPSTVMAYPLLMLLDFIQTGFRVMAMMLLVASGGTKEKKQPIFNK